MIYSLSGLPQARSSPHLNKVGQEVREAVRAEGYTDGLGQGGGCGGEGHDLSWFEGGRPVPVYEQDPSLVLHVGALPEKPISKRYACPRWMKKSRERNKSINRGVHPDTVI